MSREQDSSIVELTLSADEAKKLAGQLKQKMAEYLKQHKADWGTVAVSAANTFNGNAIDILASVNQSGPLRNQTEINTICQEMNTFIEELCNAYNLQSIPVANNQFFMCAYRLTRTQ